MYGYDYARPIRRFPLNDYHFLCVFNFPDKEENDVVVVALRNFTRLRDIKRTIPSFLAKRGGGWATEVDEDRQEEKIWWKVKLAKRLALRPGEPSQDIRHSKPHARRSLSPVNIVVRFAFQKCKRTCRARAQASKATTAIIERRVSYS